MTVYDVIDNPIYVRSHPSSSSPIINILPPGSKIYVIAEEAGWFKTISGYYVFKTDNIINKTLQVKNQVKKGMLGDGQSQANWNTINTPSYQATQEGYKQKAENEAKEATAEETAAKEETKTSDTDKTNNPEVDEVSQKLNNDPDKGVGSTIQVSKVMKVDEQGKPVLDENGNPVWIDAPDSVASAENSKFTVIDGYENNGKYVRIRNIQTGETYIAKTEEAKIGKVDSDGNTTFTDFQEYEKKAQEEADATLLEQLKSLGSGVIQQWDSFTDLTIEDARSIFGLPYQFMPIVDPRTHAENEETSASSFSKFGRKFQEKILSRAPILFMQAGTPVFMRGYSDDAKESIMSQLVGTFVNTAEDALDKLLNDQNSQYYSFSAEGNQYFKAVNTACAFMAHMLQIQHVRLPTRGRAITEAVGETIGNALDPNTLGGMDWSFRTEHQFGYYGGAVGFYINAENQIQESFTTSTRSSELASKINQISDQAMEAMFVMGGLSGALNDAGAATLSHLVGFQSDWNKDLTKGEETSPGLMNSILKNLTTLVAGGKMIFPEIWADSQFGRSYGVTIKLDSPECDTVSIFLNVLVPLAHILGFVLPRSAGPNTYVSPFLVRCFYKSSFHIDMGIITSCEITKGDAGAWNSDGLPTQITVQLTIKDLYTVLSQAMGVGSNTLISNPAQMEYLSALCGVNIAPASLIRSIELWYMANGLGTIKQSIIGTAAETIQSIFKRIQNFSAPRRWSM